jgi:hypothetical protein
MILGSNVGRGRNGRSVRDRGLFSLPRFHSGGTTSKRVKFGADCGSLSFVAGAWKA